MSHNSIAAGCSKSSLNFNLQRTNPLFVNSWSHALDQSFLSQASQEGWVATDWSGLVGPPVPTSSMPGGSQSSTSTKPDVKGNTVIEIVHRPAIHVLCLNTEVYERWMRLALKSFHNHRWEPRVGRSYGEVQTQPDWLTKQAKDTNTQNAQKQREKQTTTRKTTNNPKCVPCKQTRLKNP